MARKTTHSTQTKKHLTKEEKEQKEQKEKLAMEFADTKKSLLNKAKIPFLLDKNNPIAVNLFKELVEELYGIGVHKRGDLNNVCIYINNLIKYAQLNELINKEGFIKILVDEDTGEIIEKLNNKTLNLQKLLLDIEKQISKQGSTLGIGATERLSLLNMIYGAQTSEDEDEYEKTIVNPQDLNPQDFALNKEDIESLKELLKNE